ncbi:putative protein YrrD, contains PRC-barrel domain [Abditibacterium utsteinense]|uniref:PRC-barrel domain-containing protein n=1 Tax=Abditibacterium utsteinense TaxID=1960156 RepID=A0A2S8SUS8_9BACT|nr:PRC-barrel domain-containing protein [Abditibacterium utsteinense]PQV64553.1 putative protein YrrD, contains PRC-barrel domain [Abditibacterium utsteinense]
MRKAKSLLGLNIVSQLEGKQLGTVRDVIFDETSHRLIALLLSDRELFGMIDATVVPWTQVREIGPHAIMVPSEEVVLKAHVDPIIAESFDQKNQLDGKKITTLGGEDLGRVSDLYLDDAGKVQGFEVSGGMFSDAFSGKRYMDLPGEITVGEDVILVPQEIAAELQRQKEQEPGGLAGTAAPLTAKAGELYDSAKTKVGDTYESVANASVDKQREFVIGKTASRDVVIPADKATMATPESNNTLATETGGATTLNSVDIPEVHNSTYASATDVSSTGAVVDGEVLVRQGETITAQHADRAINAGILHQLVISAGGTAATGAYDSAKTSATGVLGQGQDAAGSYGAETQSKMETAALGKPSAREISAPDGSIIIAPGMIVTRAILDRADTYGKKNEVIAAAGLGAASEKAQDVYGSAKESAGSIWDTIKEKAAELTGTAQEKKAEYDDKTEQNKINNALGRPTTRVILAQDDSIILNTGDLITNAAVNHARQAGVLPILLDSVYTADPEITPEMLRAQGKGQDALASQAEPSGGPITATVGPTQPSQDTPEQGVR